MFVSNADSLQFFFVCETIYSWTELMVSEGGSLFIISRKVLASSGTLSVCNYPFLNSNLWLLNGLKLSIRQRASFHVSAELVSSR